jgi:hypothetical protein
VRIGRLSAGKKVGGLLALLALLLGPATAPATVMQLGFASITNNSAANVATGEAQLVVDIEEGISADRMTFTFRNTGPAASAITGVYFDGNPDIGGPLANIISIFNGTVGQVRLEEDSARPNLPNGPNATPPFVADFSLLTDPPTSTLNGVDPGELVAVTFRLKDGQTFADVLAALTNRSLRLGLHVQRFADGGSESFINTLEGPTPNPIPEPGSVILLGLGGATLLAAGIRRRLSPSASAA